MKRVVPLMIFISLCSFLISCSKDTQTPEQPQNKQAEASATPTPQPAPSKASEKTIDLTVEGTERKSEIRDTSGQDVRPTQAGNEFVVVNVKAQPLPALKGEDISMERPNGKAGQDDKWVTTSATIFIYPDSKPEVYFILRLKDDSIKIEKPLAYDDGGREFGGSRITAVPGGGRSPEVKLAFVFEVPKSTQLKTLKIEDRSLELSKSKGKQDK